MNGIEVHKMEKQGLHQPPKSHFGPAVANFAINLEKQSRYERLLRERETNVCTWNFSLRS